MAISYFADGQWNFTCDLCGAIAKSDKAVKTWDGFYVCAKHKEVRNPQDFIRGVRGEQVLPWTRPGEHYQQYCTYDGRSSTAGYMVAGCSIAGNPHN
jgi:hypothetical protein